MSIVGFNTAIEDTLAYVPDTILSDGVTTISTNKVHFRTTVGATLTSTIYVSTSDSSALRTFQVSLIEYSSNYISYEVNSVSPFETVIVLTYAPTDVQNVVSLLTLDFGSETVSIEVQSIATISPSNVTTLDSSLDFGTVNVGDESLKELFITFSGFSYNPKLVNLSYDGIVNPSAVAAYLIYNVTFNGNIVTIPIHFKPLTEGTLALSVSIYYDGVKVMEIPFTGVGNLLPSTAPLYDPLAGLPPSVPAPSTGMETAMPFKNKGKSLLRITGLNIIGDSLSEYALKNVDVILGTVLQPSEVIYILADYTPKSSKLTLPILDATCEQFTPT